jgi:hypothetical protein
MEEEDTSNQFHIIIKKQDEKLEDLSASIQGIRQKSYIIKSEMDGQDG